MTPIDLRDVRMVERRQRLRLALETGEPVGIGREELRQDLDGNVAIEFQIAGAIHLAHAAGAQKRHDLVRTYPRGGLNQHWPVRRIISGRRTLEFPRLCGEI